MELDYTSDEGRNSQMLNVLVMRRRVRAMGLVAAAGLFSVFAAGSYAPALAQESTPADASPTVDCNVDEAVAAAPSVYTVSSEESTASYVAQEELASVGANEVVGTTNAIIGSILFDEDGTPLECSNFAVDMRTLVTDESRRDNYLRSNTLESDTFPYAMFVLDTVEGLDGGLEDGASVTGQLIGDFTLHGVTRSVAWDAEFTRDGDTITGTATTTFLIADYEMEKPIVGPVVSIDDEIVLNVEITATTEA
jgi:polyisoprenoid-binding protein YceI